MHMSEGSVYNVTPHIVLSSPCEIFFYEFVYSECPGQTAQPGTELIILFSCSTQLSMKFVPLINLKLLTTANSFLLNIAEHENFSANKYENANYCWHFHIY